MAKQGIIFDLDGVLVSTDKLHYLAWKRLAQELGITEFTEADNEKQRGVSRMESLEVVLEKGGQQRQYSQEEKINLAERKNEYYKELLETLDESALLANVPQTLKLLRSKGYKIGIGSVSKNTSMILQKTGIADLIDKVSCGLDITKSKPDPEVFLVAAKKLGLEPGTCLVVEDSAAGIAAAKRGGMKSLGVGPYFETLNADYQARSLAEQIDWEHIME